MAMDDFWTWWWRLVAVVLLLRLWSIHVVLKEIRDKLERAWRAS